MIFKMRYYKIDFDMKNIPKIINEFVDEVKIIDGVLAVYVFGSYVSGKIGPLSDIDVCIIGDVFAEDKMKILLGKFPEILDISFFNDLSIWMKFRVLKEGRCLAVSDNQKLNKLKLITIGEYLDFKPVINDIIEKELAINV